jgi:hypothetical protein
MRDIIEALTDGETLGMLIAITLWTLVLIFYAGVVSGAI